MMVLICVSTRMGGRNCGETEFNFKLFTYYDLLAVNPRFAAGTHDPREASPLRWG